MSFDPKQLEDVIARHGRVARIVVAEAAGSAPREAGASMLVWATGQSGTIGGGRLEFEATETARKSLSGGPAGLQRVPLGPALGQCCGGAVTLATEVFDRFSLEAILTTERSGCVLRAPGRDTAPVPLTVERYLGKIRNGSLRSRTRLIDGWLVEPLHAADNTLWIYGAGHVGRAIVDTMSRLKNWHITWIDTHFERFPDAIPPGTEPLVAQSPPQVVGRAPRDAHHLILTYSHALDLELCHALLARGFASAGLIGSATKWRRFCKRLVQLGHSEASIARITCPIGDPTLGKEPQAIAVGVTALLLRATAARAETAMERPA